MVFVSKGFEMLAFRFSCNKHQAKISLGVCYCSLICGSQSHVHPVLAISESLEGRKSQLM